MGPRSRGVGGGRVGRERGGQQQRGATWAGATATTTAMTLLPPEKVAAEASYDSNLAILFAFGGERGLDVCGG